TAPPSPGGPGGTAALPERAPTSTLDHSTSRRKKDAYSMMEANPRGFDAGRAPSLAEDPALGLDRRAKFEILGAVMLALFLGALDQTIVGTALPRIITDLHGNELYTWVVTIYLLTSTITVPFYGKLSDLFGRKPLLMIGVTLFLVGSALSGLSQDIYQLILFRGIQGIGAGSLFPISLAVIGDLFTPAERGKYQGLFGAVFGLSSILGPGLGGFITDTISWHWVFYVNIPIGLVSLFVIWRLLPVVKRPTAPNLDFLGAAVFTVAIGFFLVGLTNKQAGNWTDVPVGGYIGIGLLLGLVFLLIEARAKEPIVPLDLWRNRTYASSIISTFLVSFGFFGAIIFLPRWYQFVKGIGATESGYQIMPLLIGLILSSIVSGQIVARTGRYKLLVVVSILVMAGGLALMTNLRAETDTPVLWLWMFVAGLGIGPTFAVFTIIVQNAVPFDRLGVATSNLTFFRQIGGSIGLAIAGTLFATSFQDKLAPELVARGVPGPAAQQFAGFATGAGGSDVTAVGVDLGTTLAHVLPPAAQSLIPNIVAGVHEAFSLAISSTFYFSVAAVAAAALVALVMAELPLRTTLGPRPAPAESRRLDPSAAVD
ncbi:MAG TPA: MDR family MFS transporter, partial [Candidatus Limnocylindrales bacterium]